MKLKIESLPILDEVTIQKCIWGKNELIQISFQDRGKTNVVIYSTKGVLLSAPGIYTDVLRPLTLYVSENLDTLRKKLNIENTKFTIKQLGNPAVSKMIYLGKHNIMGVLDVYYSAETAELHIFSSDFHAVIGTNNTDISIDKELPDIEIRFLLVFKRILKAYIDNNIEITDSLTFAYRPTTNGVRYTVYRDNDYMSIDIKDGITVSYFGSFMLGEVERYKKVATTIDMLMNDSNLEYLLKEVG